MYKALNKNLKRERERPVSLTASCAFRIGEVHQEHDNHHGHYVNPVLGQKRLVASLSALLLLLHFLFDLVQIGLRVGAHRLPNVLYAHEQLQMIWHGVDAECPLDACRLFGVGNGGPRLYRDAVQVVVDARVNGQVESHARVENAAQIGERRREASLGAHGHSLFAQSQAVQRVLAAVLERGELLLGVGVKVVGLDSSNKQVGAHGRVSVLVRALVVARHALKLRRVLVLPYCAQVEFAYLLEVACCVDRVLEYVDVVVRRRELSALARRSMKRLHENQSDN